MRPMLDYVQVQDLALIGANRVLNEGGNFLVGMYVEGGKSGKSIFFDLVKEFVKHSLIYIGINKYRDMHTWRPSYKNLITLIEDGGLVSLACIGSRIGGIKLFIFTQKKIIKNKHISK
jgi:hypothetical protein